jgi:hypothetical protein
MSNPVQVWLGIISWTKAIRRMSFYLDVTIGLS